MEPLKYLIYYNLFSDTPAMDTYPVSPNHAMLDMIVFVLVCVLIGFLIGYLIGFWEGSREKEEYKR